MLGCDDGTVEVMLKGSALPVTFRYTDTTVICSDDDIILGSAVGEVLGSTLEAADGIKLGIDEGT